MMKATKLIPAIDGIFLLNKEPGMTSNVALQRAKRLFGAEKAGHTGSLDPMATGMLPICFGQATKMCQYLLNEDKTYSTTGLLGIKTSTADATGEVIACCENFLISEIALTKVLSNYQGRIKQIPSMYSALKHNGRPLYCYAREGIEIDRKARDIQISQLRLDSFDGKQFSLTVTCSKGTYIRNLVEDVGEDLGVGAHVTRLHRVHTAGFAHTPMYTLDELRSMSLDEKLHCLIPMDKAVSHLELVTLSDAEVCTIRQGRIVTNKIQADAAACVRLYDLQKQFIGLGELKSNGDLKAKRLVSFESKPKPKLNEI